MWKKEAKMYLSRLVLDPDTPRARQEMELPYEMHRHLMSAFPRPESGRVLFRVEEAPLGRRGLPVLVQSEKEPDWGRLHRQQYLLPVQDNPAVKPYDPVITAGRVFAFRLRANPTKKIEGKKLGLYREDEQQDWLARKAGQGGFAVLSVNLTREGTVAGRMGKGQRFPLVSVRYDGVLKVVEPGLFLATLRTGVGQSQCFGFAMLSLARP
jgi:CRISPR system Cascade subunit CasE